MGLLETWENYSIRCAATTDDVRCGCNVPITVYLRNSVPVTPEIEINHRLIRKVLLKLSSRYFKPEYGTGPEATDPRRVLIGTTERAFTVYRVARLRSASHSSVCRVRSLSDSRIELVSCLELSAGDPVAILFPEMVVLAGKITNSAGARLTIELVERIDARATLRLLSAESVVVDHRPARIATSILAVAMTPVGIRPIRVLDVSQRGMKISHDDVLARRNLTQVTLPTGLQRRALVRWATNQMAGLRLLEPFSVEELDLIVNGQSARPQIATSAPITPS